MLPFLQSAKYDLYFQAMIPLAAKPIARNAFIEINCKGDKFMN